MPAMIPECSRPAPETLARIRSCFGAYRRSVPIISTSNRWIPLPPPRSEKPYPFSPATIFSRGKIAAGWSPGSPADAAAVAGAGAAPRDPLETIEPIETATAKSVNFTLRTTPPLPISIPSRASSRQDSLLTAEIHYVTFDPDDLRRFSGRLGRKHRPGTGNPLVLQRDRPDRQGRSRNPPLLLARLLDHHLREVRPAAPGFSPVGKVRRVLPKIPALLRSQH